MSTIKITFSKIDEERQDILIAQLSELGYEGFEQNPGELLAYIADSKFNEAALVEVADGLEYIKEAIAQQNWNELWESNFEPVVVEDFCTLRADFHDIEVTTPYDIIITPKMSFGTGHHATTQLVMLMMKDIDMKGKQVLDFGTGTGVLAILAEKLGASYILAIDNDDWSVENARENAERNGCNNITIIKVDGDQLPAIQTDLILANINRHILLQYMHQLYTNTKMGGTVVMSGLLVEDKEIIMTEAKKAGLTFFHYAELNNWISLVFKKGVH